MRYFYILLFIFAWDVCYSQTLSGVDTDDSSWRFSADSVEYERALGLTIAEGSVVIERGLRRLQADKVIYDDRDGSVTASGSVRITDESGNIYDADYAEVSDDFRRAFIENIEIRLGDYGVLRASRGERSDGLFEFASPSYSACEVCADRPDAPLLWELRAGRVIHDERRKVLKYYDARLDFGGVPVFYVPYFVYPDPSVRRKDGFLFSDFGSDRSIGSYISVPYFVTLGAHADLTLNPIFTAKGGQLASGRFRSRHARARIDGEASFTEAHEVRSGENRSRLVARDSDRWHVRFSGDFHLNEQWRLGARLDRASDSNYFRRYPFWGDPGNFLRSGVYAERFSGRNYFSFTTHSFQDLRLTDRDSTPRILPNVDMYFYGARDSMGGLWSFYSNLRLQDKAKFIEDRRIFGRFSYDLPYYSDSGYVFRLGFNVYSRFQSSDFRTGLNSFGYAARDSDSASVLPQLGLRFSVPLHRRRGAVSETIEPIFVAYVSPKSVNRRNVNNSDSSIYSLDSHNIFLGHRLNGFDRFDGGHRFAYGLRGERYSGSLLLRGFLGQLYEFSEDSVLSEELRIESGASDIVASGLLRMDLVSGSGLDLGVFNFDNQLRLSRRSGEVNRYFSQGVFGDEDLSLGFNYLYVRSGLVSGLSGQEEVSFTGEKRLSRYWRGGVFSTFRLGGDSSSSSSLSSRSRRYGSYLLYDDECFIFRLQGSRDFTRTSDVGAGYSVLATFSLKTLGGVGSLGNGRVSGIIGSSDFLSRF